METNIILSPRKFVAPEYIFGVDSRLMAAIYCKKLSGRNILLVTDAGLLSTKWVAEIEDNLKQQSLNYVVFSAISPNPRDYEVMNGKKVYDDNKCNLILAIGGGSVIDCAKGIGIVVSNNGHICEYEGVDMIHKPIALIMEQPTFLDRK